MSLEIHKMPSISTGHLTKEVADILTAQGDGNPWCPCATWEYGYFLFLDEPEAGLAPVPQCLLDIRDWLRKQEAAGLLDNSRWVRLDGDSDSVDEIPTYNW